MSWNEVCAEWIWAIVEAIERTEGKGSEGKGREGNGMGWDGRE